MTTPNLGPLEILLQDPDILEIMVDAPDRVLVERKGKLEPAGVAFRSVEELRAVIDTALAIGGAAFAPGQTVCDTRLSDGSRILAVLPPTAVKSPYLIIRKFYTRGMTWEKLLKLNALDEPTYQLLLGALNGLKTMLIAGGTGSGKTTILNLLAESVNPEERLIVIGAEAELPVKHPRRIHLDSDSRTALSMTDLLDVAAKMRPERIIISDLFGPETLRAIQLMSSGLDGCLASIHATNVDDALARLEIQCLMANAGLGLGEIRGLIVSGLHVIVTQKRLGNGARKITGVFEVQGLENDRYLIQPLMRYNPDTDAFERTGAKASWE